MRENTDGNVKMSFITDFFEALAHWMRPYLGPISMAFVATILIIYGDNINKAIKQQFSGVPFLVRLSVFVALCAFGYAALTILMAKFLEVLFKGLPDAYLSPFIIVLFLLAGILAERKNQL